MTPEAHHLLAALHEPEGRNEALLASLTPPDWARLVRLAMRQRVAPVLQATPGLIPPSSSQQQLRKYAEHAAARVLRQQAALLTLADAVEPRGVRLVALKGLHLGLDVYASPALREMGDIDLLVSEPDLEVVQTAAIDLGFTPLPAGVADHHAPPLVRDGIVVELHLQLDSRSGSPAATDTVWSRVLPLPLGRTLWGLGPEDLLVHVAMHGFDAHVMELGLRSLCDVRAILQKHGAALDGGYLWEQASIWRAARALELALALLERQLGYKVPDGVRGKPVDTDLLDTAVEHIFDQSRPTSESAASFIDANWTSRLRIVKERVLHPAAGPPLWRTIGLARRHGAWLMRTALARNGSNQALERRRKLRAWLRS